MQKISGKPKLMLYAFSGMGVNMLNLMMGSYLCSALIASGFVEKVLPFQTYVGKDLVIAGVWAVFSLVARILDGIIDVPMASFTDQLKTRWGRRRPSIVIGLVPMIIAYLLFLVVPNPGGATLLNTIYYGVLLCIFYSFYTLTMVSYYATYTEIVETEQERSLISNTKSFFDIVYFILGYVVVRMMLNNMNIRLVALIVLPLVATMLIPLFMIKEESSLESDRNKSNAKRSVGLFESLRHTAKNRTFILWMIVYAFMTFGVQLFLGGINEYFAAVGMNMMLVMIAAFAPVPFALILYNKFIRRYGFGFAFRYTLITYTLGMAAMFIVGKLADGSAKTVLAIITGLISSLAIGSLFAVAYSIPSQLAAEEEERSGVANSAMYFAVQGLFAGVASGIATGVVLTALKKAGVEAVSYTTLICAIGTAVAFALTFILPKSLINMGRKTK
ncbi:MAG: MFS transporter [Clostridia bacterium]|nr:MFS transporter [Clostridia bacterium]